MAQAGYTPISLYYSTTSTQEPTAGNLVSGELAINIADGKLFYKNSAGNVRLLSIGYGSSSVTPTNGGVQYGTGTALALTAAGSSGQILRSNGAAAPTWADLSTLGVNTISFGTTGLTPNSATAGAVTVAGTLVTANGGTGLGGATPFTANGVLYASSASALTSGSALTFDGTKLTIGTATAAGALTVVAPASTAYGAFDAPTAGFAFHDYKYNGTRYGLIGQGSALYVSGSNTDFGVLASNALVFGASGTEGMRLTSTGLGIGTSSPSAKLHVSTSSAGSYGAIIYNTSATGEGLTIRGGSTSSHNALVVQDYNGANSLLAVQGGGNVGIGTSSISSKLVVKVQTNANAEFRTTDAIFGTVVGGVGIDALNDARSSVVPFGIRGSTLSFGTSAGLSATLDSSGNLGLGVTPSAWNTAGGTRAFEFNNNLGSGSVAGWFSSVNLMNNAIFSATGGGTMRYVATGVATQYQQTAGSHLWLTAPSGTAGDAITFTQAMTLDASGNLLVGQTSGVYRLDVAHASAGEIARFSYTGGSKSPYIATIAQSDTVMFLDAQNSDNTVALGIRVSGAERARITSGGLVQVSSGGSVQIGDTAARATTAGTNRLDIFNGTAPVGTLSNGISIYSSSGEAYVMDAAGNATLFSPHDAETNEWIFKSKHTPTGKTLKIDVEKLLRFINDHFGLDAVHEFIEP